MMDERLRMKEVKEIKQSFRLLMNGVTASSMRQKGVEYKLNWGVNILDLQRMAADYGKDYELAVELWKEDIRECKLLATMIMPAEEMPSEMVDIWMEQTRSQEMIEMAVFNLYQHLPYAAQKAFQWMAADNDLYQIAAYLLLARLFMQGLEPDERGINEIIDNAVSALEGGTLQVKHAALKCLTHLAELGDTYEVIVKQALKANNLDVLL